MTPAEWLALTICAALCVTSAQATHHLKEQQRKDGRS